MSRVEKTQEKLKENSLEAIMITSEYNLRYASEFTGTTGLSVITQNKAYFVTDFRYTEQAASQVKGFEIIENKGPIYDEVENIIQKDNLKAIGFEEAYLSYKTYKTLADKFTAELIPVSNMIEELREIKEAHEVETIKKAIQITEEAFEHVLTTIQPGQTEIEIANQLDFFMRGKGASQVSFDTIVASGVRSAMPHGVASDKKIEKGDMITLDFGCYYNGYVSDMTRTFAIGDPGQQLKDIYQIVLDAQLKVNEAAKPGVTGKELDAIARDYITKAGYGDHFGHGTGHGIGLEVHEGPTISKRNDKPLVAGNIITNEPGIYLPGIGGVRIEDDLLITESGNENLMNSSKELIIL